MNRFPKWQALAASGCLLISLAATGAGAAEEDKILICHFTRAGAGQELVIPASAFEAHQHNHGDHLVEPEICGDGIDNDCNGVVDDADLCLDCPCFNLRDLQAFRLIACRTRDSQNTVTANSDNCSANSGFLFDFVGASNFVRNDPVTGARNTCFFREIDDVTCATLEMRSAPARITDTEAQACYDLLRSHLDSLILSCL